MAGGDIKFLQNIFSIKRKITIGHADCIVHFWPGNGENYMIN